MFQHFVEITCCPNRPVKFEYIEYMNSHNHTHARLVAASPLFLDPALWPSPFQSGFIGKDVDTNYENA